jgi:hypothetical protein
MGWTLLLCLYCILFKKIISFFLYIDSYPLQIAPMVQCGVSWLLRISSSVIELVTDGNIQSFINIQLFNVVWLVTLFMLFNEFDHIRVKYFKWVCTPYEKNNMNIFSCDIERLLNHYAKFSQSSLGLWCIIF